MTDEERKALIINLRWLGHLDYEPEIAQPCLKGADEIERLAKENAQLKDITHQRNCDLMNTQSDVEPGKGDFAKYAEVFNREHAEPVAWRWRLKGHDDGEWAYWDLGNGSWPDDIEAEPLFTAPPRPDAD